MASISVPLPLGSYVTNDPSASCKRLVNVFSEPAPADSVLLELKSGSPQESAPVFLRRWPGLLSFATNGTSNAVRGMWLMQGVVYAVIGPTLYSVSSTGVLAQLGTGISGTGFVRMTDNTACLVILVPGTTACYTYCPNAGATFPLSNVRLISNGGDFTCDATSLATGMFVQVSGTLSGSGVISGYVNPSTYVIHATNGSTTFTLETESGSSLTTLVGSLTGLTFTVLGQPLFQPLTDPTFLQYGAIDVHFLDSYIVFLAENGRTFYNDDGQAASGQYQITFTSNGIFPREFGTDLFVGMGCDHRELTFFGTNTSEGFLNVGNPIGTPFSSAPQSFMEMGCHPDAAYSIGLQDQAIIWVANDRTVRRKNGQTPQRVSNSGIEAILEHANLAGSYALTPSIAGHPLWVYVMPSASRTIVFDCLTEEWFELDSFGLGYWRGLAYLNAYGKQLVGDSQGHGIGTLDTHVDTEFGTLLVSSFTTQPLYQGHNRIVHRRLELVTTVGGGGNSGALVSLQVSDDANTFRGLPMRNLGSTGSYWDRAVWFNLGQARSRIYRFVISDSTPMFAIQITAEVEMSKW